MEQGSEVAPTTDMRRFLYALRPLAMLGGFVVMWWCLATGAAQADAGLELDRGTANRVTAATADRVTQEPVQHAVDRVRVDRAEPAKVVRTVRVHTSPALVKTLAIAKSTPAGPIVTRASDTVRSQATQVVEQARAVLQTAPVAGSVIPQLEGVANVVENLPLEEASSTLQGESRHLTSFDATSQTALTGRGQASPSSRSGGGSEGPALESSGVTAASSAQSGSGSRPGVGLGEAGPARTLLATKTPNSSLADWQPAGPAYPPASSPD